MKKNYLRTTFLVCALVCAVAIVFSLMVFLVPNHSKATALNATAAIDGNSLIYVIIIAAALALVLIVVRLGVRKHIEEYDRVTGELEKERFRGRAVRKLSDEIVFEYDKPTDTLFVYPSAHNALRSGQGPHIIEELKSKANNRALGMLHEDDYSAVERVCEGSIPQGFSVRLERHIGDERKYLPYEIRAVKKTLAKNSQLVVGTLVPVCENEDQKDFLDRLYERDELTGLLNRSAAKKACEKLAGKGTKPKALMLIDFDNFAAVNGQFGHITGDALLKNFSVELTETFAADDVIARIGGDEFMVFINDASDRESIDEKCRKILKVFSDGSTHSSVRENMSISMGVSIQASHFAPFSKLEASALSALKEAKDEGKNKIVYSS